MKKRIGVWIRVSTEDQAKGESPKHHEERAKMYAQVKDWHIVETYHLEAVSGKSVMSNAEAQRMMKDIKRGHITGLIFSKLARLARNTKELLEFADYFNQHNADLISLEESIDTSTPAGRFFYTLIAAMAEWEREEISSRIKASVPIRARLGKSLGGDSPYGYSWVDKELVINETEAPIRKLIFELFAKHKRKRAVAHMLNEKGYRTRRGNGFSDTLVDNILRDPISKGMRRTNYTTDHGNKLKPKEEWIFVEAPRIVTDELWETCNAILDEISQKQTKTRRRGVHLFSGIVHCTCGGKMYMRSNSPKYVCNDCKNKIEPDILEDAFHLQLKDFIFSDDEIQKHLSEEVTILKEKETLLKASENEYQKLKTKVFNLLDLYHEGNMSKQAFEEYHTPLYEELKQRESSLLSLQGEIDEMKMQSLSNEQVIHDARDLHSQWKTFSQEDKKSIIEAITKSVVVGTDTITMNLLYIPTFKKNAEPHSSSLIDTTMQKSLEGCLWY